MPNVIRYTDICYGHSCWPPRANDEGRPTVIVNNLQIHTVGDHWPTHCWGPDWHDGVAATGSSSVFAENRNVCRINDLVSCGSVMGQTHSPDVIAGG